MITVTDNPKPNLYLRFPKLMVSKTTRNIFLIVGSGTKGLKGVNIMSSNYREDWAASSLIDYEGEITLENRYER